jgi:hypothetical protein
MDGEYDNTNRGALWPCKGFCGRVNIGGSDMFVLMVQSMAKSENAPVYRAVIRDGENEYILPVWRPKNKESKVKGTFQYGNHTINIFVNEKRQSENAPALSLSVMEREMQPQQGGAQPNSSAPTQDDCPF